MYKKIICAIVVVCSLLSVFAPACFATEPEPKPVNAEIMDVYEGRDSIISMTFDDGYYNVALTLQQLFEEYDLYGSLMMIADRSIVDETSSHNGKTYATAELWNALFDEGRLEPQSHSSNHYRIAGDETSIEVTPEILKYEMIDSKTKLENLFPEYDCLSYAIPYGNMVDEAYEYASEIYYALRTTMNGVQTLDPDYSTNYGSWYAMRSPSLYRNGTVFESQWATIKGDIDAVVQQKGWYLPIVHRVGDIDLTELPTETARVMFQYISDLRDEGKVWVTTYSNAIKYVRERQNSHVGAWNDGTNIHVCVTMDYTAPDGKELPLDVFNHPLTVKVEVPDNIGSVFYTTGGKEYSAVSFSDGGKRYVHVNIIPDGSDVKLRTGSTHTYGQTEKYDDEYHKQTCTDCGVENLIKHTWDDGTVIVPATCTTAGSKLCICTACGESAELETAPNDNHDFSKTDTLYFVEKANCKHGALYNYFCSRCGARGTETFEVGAKKEHDFGKWKIVQHATETEDGYKERVCDDCGEKEQQTIPKTGNDDPEPDVPTEAEAEEPGWFKRIINAILDFFRNLFGIKKKDD